MGTWERGEVAPPADTFLELVELYNADITALLPRRKAPPMTPEQLRERRELEQEVERLERENARNQARAKKRGRSA